MCLCVSHNTHSYLGLVKVDGDFEAGVDGLLLVSQPVGPPGPGSGPMLLQLGGEAGLQPLAPGHHLHLLHLLLADAEHLAAEVLHLLVLQGVQLVEAWGGREGAREHDITGAASCSTSSLE